MSTVISTPDAPGAIGPYVQGRVFGNTLYTSGCIAIDPHDKDRVIDDVVDQARQCLQNMNAIIEAAGFKKEDVIKTTVYLLDMNDFDRVNQVYSEFFGEHKPCRTCIQAGRLPKAYKVEIECVAMH